MRQMKVERIENRLQVKEFHLLTIHALFPSFRAESIEGYLVIFYHFMQELILPSILCILLL
jgi:hypothetical protein